MALLAEQLVDEWMNRQGFFTVRGIKEGVDEIDLLGVRPSSDAKKLEAWHVEVQVSFNPNAYISKLSRDEMAQLGVKNRNSAKQRPLALLELTAKEWVEGKFHKKRKVQMREQRWSGLSWRLILVHAEARYPIELEIISKLGIQLVPFAKVLNDLQATDGAMRGHSGTDLMEIISYFSSKQLPR
jgi:hypothetical protein